MRIGLMRYFIAHQAVSPESLRISDSRESPDSRESCELIRANHATKVKKRLLRRSEQEFFEPTCLGCIFSNFLLKQCRKNMATASGGAYLLGTFLLFTGEKVSLFDPEKHDQFWSSFLFLPFSLFCLEMAKICCFFKGAQTMKCKL